MASRILQKPKSPQRPPGLPGPLTSSQRIPRVFKGSQGLPKARTPQLFSKAPKCPYRLPRTFKAFQGFSGFPGDSQWPPSVPKGFPGAVKGPQAPKNFQMFPGAPSGAQGLAVVSRAPRGSLGVRHVALFHPQQPMRNSQVGILARELSLCAGMLRVTWLCNIAFCKIKIGVLSCIV
jgi:hypothetical protein